VSNRGPVRAFMFFFQKVCKTKNLIGHGQPAIRSVAAKNKTVKNLWIWLILCSLTVGSRITLPPYWQF